MTATTKKTKKAPATKKEVDKKTEVIKRKIELLKQRADAYKAKAREATMQAKEMSSSLLKSKGVTLRKRSPQSESVVEEAS